ncbi:hypothetical protein PGH43_02065 [Legionella pneumophila 130b]|nr:hypothetical protein PGH43_02065 [Legionella pneumophila 130b]
MITEIETLLKKAGFTYVGNGRGLGNLKNMKITSTIKMFMAQYNRSNWLWTERMTR